MPQGVRAGSGAILLLSEHYVIISANPIQNSELAIEFDENPLLLNLILIVIVLIEIVLLYYYYIIIEN